MSISSNLPATQPHAKPSEVLTSQLRSRRDNIQLPAHITHERFEATVLAAVAKDPKLLTADRSSLILACMMAASDGLLPNGKDAALVIMGGKVAYMPMVGGLLRLMRNSGEISMIMAATVYAADEFGYELGLEPKLVHKPAVHGPRGEAVCYYAAAKLKDSSTPFVVLHMDDIKKIKAASRSSGSGPWVQWPDRMGEKSALRRLAKFLPSSADLDRVLDHDDEQYSVSRTPAVSPLPQVPAPEVAFPAESDDSEYDGCSDHIEGVVE